MRYAEKGNGNMNRPFTTLFMLMSVDGKISTGFGDELDFDRDLPLIDGVKQGLHQYYEIEQTTDLSDDRSLVFQYRKGDGKDRRQ